jgi:hypothetical protein
MPQLTTPKENKPATQADAPQILLEHTSLQGEKLRVVIMHAPGIDYFVVVERFDRDQWITVKRGLKELFSPVSSVMEVAILQLAQQLCDARDQIQRLQSPV